MAKPKLLERATPDEAASSVIEAFVAAYKAEGATWQANYKGELDKYTANPAAIQQAKLKLGNWYASLVRRKADIMKVFAEIRGEHKATLEAILKARK